MKSYVVQVDNHDKGFHEAIAEAKNLAHNCGLDERHTLELQLMMEEMLSLVRSVTGQMDGDIWIECENGLFELHLVTERILDQEMRREIISASTSNQNEAANSFLGRLRDALEQAMASAVTRSSDSSEEVPSDFAWHEEDAEWDRYEDSVLRQLADEVKIDIRGTKVHMTVLKRFWVYTSIKE